MAWSSPTDAGCEAAECLIGPNDGFLHLMKSLAETAHSHAGSARSGNFRSKSEKNDVALTARWRAVLSPAK
jgi:hypothetical protein